MDSSELIFGIFRLALIEQLKAECAEWKEQATEFESDVVINKWNNDFEPGKLNLVKLRLFITFRRSIE